MKSNPQLKKLILEVVHNQLRANDPPETGQTLDRLLREGYSRTESLELIAHVVASEIFDVLKKQETFNLERFV